MTDAPTRRIVLVSGAPGAGKTTLARPLAAALGFPLLSKDLIKETLYDALDPAAGLAESRRLGGAAMQVLWALAGCCPAAVLEANFRPHSDLERSRLTGLAARIVEVHCACPPAVAARRFADRAGGAHRAHVLRQLSPQLLAEFDRPVGVGAVLPVDTTTEVPIESLAAAVRDRLDPA